MRYKLLSAASAIAMALAIGGAQAAEVLTDKALDTIVAGQNAAAAAVGAGAAAAQAGTTCSGGCSITDGVTTTFVGHGTSVFAQSLGS